MKKGFTLGELLIIVAIITVLVAIAIPIFTSQLERSREATDLSNARSAYSELMVAALTDDKQSILYQGDNLYEIIITLKQKIDGWTIDASNLNIGGINSNNPNWIGSPKSNGLCKISYNYKTDIIIIDWSGGNNINYLNAVKPYQGKSLIDLKNIDNNDRVAADQATLRALGEEILSKKWNIRELKNQLGILSNGNTIRIADYYQDKIGSYETGNYQSNGFRINSKNEFLNILNSIGYNGGSSTASGNETTFQNSLFYSDELAANNFHNYSIEETKRSIIIEGIKTDSNGIITEMVIYSKAMDNQANLSNEEKAKFRITIK